MHKRKFCLEKAAEAESLAELVSLNTDKARLKAQAAEWRTRADQVVPPSGKPQR